MQKFSLNVGPSQISDAIKQDIREINDSDLLSESHRGPVIQGLLKDTVASLKAGMGLPDEYLVYFHPSASAVMELVLRNCVRRSSFHYVSGAFAQRFAKTSTRIGLEATRYETEWDQPFVPEEARPPAETELLAITHAETSTGRMWPAEEIHALRERYPEPLLAVDATSTFGALRMDWRDADVWLGSVQKCLGLPAGLGYAVVSPRVLERARELGDARRVASWQDLLVMQDRIEKGETVETPNVFDIALLGRVAKRLDIDRVEADTRAKAALVADVLGDERFFVREPAWRSLTVHNLRAEAPEDWKAWALEAGAVIGAGYGPLKTSCVRIATFPAVDIEHLERPLRAIASGLAAGAAV